MLHINGEIGGGVPIGMFGSVPDPQPFTFLGADPAVAEVIAVQKAINAAARAVGLAANGPEGGLFVQRNFELAQSVASEVLSKPKRRQALLSKGFHVASTSTVTSSSAVDGKGAIDNLTFIDRETFKQVEARVEEPVLVGGVVATYELVAETFGRTAGLSTGAKVAIGAGALIVLGGGLAFALRPRGTIGHLGGGRKKVCIEKPMGRPARFAIGFAGGAAVGALGELGLRQLRARQSKAQDPLGTGGAPLLAAGLVGLFGGAMYALPAPEIPCN